jgi:hypothetical protein
LDRGRGRAPGPLVGVAIGAALGSALFLLAALLHDSFFPRRGPGRPPEGFSAGVDPRAPVRVLATLPGEPGPGAVLMPLREDGGSAGAEEALLDREVFPGGPRHRWARLVVTNPPGAPALRLSLAAGAVVLRAPDGPAGNVDLAGAIRDRAASLSPHRLLDLRVARATDAEVVVPPGAFVRAVVAFPAGADPTAASEAVLGGVARLLPREAGPDRLRTLLLEGGLDGLRDSERAEAPGEKGAPGEPR